MKRVLLPLAAFALAFWGYRAVAQDVTLLDIGTSPEDATAAAHAAAEAAAENVENLPSLATMKPDHGINRSSWMDLVGLEGAEAVSKIMSSAPEIVTVEIVQPDQMVTMDFRQDRVRVYVDEDGHVKETPQIG